MFIFVSLIQLIVPLNVDSVKCPENSSEWRQREMIFSCTSGTYYHCLPDENGFTTELCIERSWIQPGFCPIFVRESKKVDVRLCQESNGKCPLRTYWTNDVFEYTACMPANYIRNVSVTGSRATSRYAVKGTTPLATTRNASTKRNQSSDIGNEVSVAVIIVPIIVVLLLCGVAAALLLWYRRRRLKNDRTEQEQRERCKLRPTAEPGTASPLIYTPSTCTTDIETIAPVAVQASGRKKLSKDDTFEYSARIAVKARPRLQEKGILILVCESKKFMAEVGQSLALTCDTQEFPSGFKEYLESFVEMEENNQKTKCIVFNNCFQKEGNTIKFFEYKHVFEDLYEKQVMSEGRLRFVIAIQWKLWNARKVTFSRWKLFHEKYIFKFNSPAL